VSRGKLNVLIGRTGCGRTTKSLHEEALHAFAAGSTGAYDLVEAYWKRAPGG
jgi:hypothetical protein